MNLSQEFQSRDSENNMILNELQKTKQDFANLKLAYTRLDQQIANYAFMDHINTYFGTTLDQDELIRSLTDAIIGILGVTGCILMLDWQNQRQCAFKSADDNKNIKQILTPDNYKKIRLRLKSQDQIYIADLEKNNFLQMKCGSILIVPVVRADKNFGILVVYQSRPDFFNTMKIELFSSLSRQLAIFFENSYLYEQSKKREITDGLTELYNQIFFDRFIEISQKNADTKYAVIMYQFDELRKVNEEYGAAAGDLIIKQLGQIIQSTFKHVTEHQFRYSRERFIVVLENVVIKNVHYLAEKVQKDFVGHGFIFDHKKNTYMLSIGMSTFDENEDANDLENLVKRADDALKYSQIIGGGYIAICTNKLRLLVQAKTMIETEIHKARRYRWDIQVKYVKFHLNKTSISHSRCFELVTSTIEQALRNSDILFKTEDMQFLMLLHGKLEDSLLQQRIKKYFAESELKGTGYTLDITTYSFPEDQENYMTKLGMIPKRVGALYTD